MIVNSSQQGITSCDAQGIITSWNKGAEQIFGYPSEEVIGKPLSIFLPPEVDALELESNIRKCLKADFTPPYEVCRLHKSGKRIYISICAFLASKTNTEKLLGFVQSLEMLLLEKS